MGSVDSTFICTTGEQTGRNDELIETGCVDTAELGARRVGKGWPPPRQQTCRQRRTQRETDMGRLETQARGRNKEHRSYKKAITQTTCTYTVYKAVAEIKGK